MYKMKVFKFLFFVFLISCGNGETDRTDTVNLQEEEIENFFTEENNRVDFYQVENDTSFFETGEIRSILVYIDEVDIEYEYMFFYKNGQIESTGKQGNVFGCGNTVGFSYEYDSLGNCLTKKYYDHFLLEGEEGCHETRTVISVTEFYSNGEIKSTYKIETCYECDECYCGLKETFDLQGNRIEYKSYGECKDGVLDCLDDL